MTAPFGALFPAAAIAAALAAVWAGPDYAVAVPASVLAVAMGGLTLMDAIRRRGARRARVASPLPMRSPGVRDLLRGGATARAQIVELLDRIDREGDHPELPRRPDAELHRIALLSSVEFHRYVVARLDALEGAS